MVNKDIILEYIGSLNTADKQELLNVLKEEYLNKGKYNEAISNIKANIISSCSSRRTPIEISEENTSYLKFIKKEEELLNKFLKS